MAQLMIISETGMFHSACRCTFPASQEWYGFKPVAHRSPYRKGFVDRENRSPSINHFAVFQVPDLRLRSALDAVNRQYADRTYALGVCDCVSYTADIARAAGLRVPLLNITPYGFLATLVFWNPCPGLDVAA